MRNQVLAGIDAIGLDWGDARAGFGVVHGVGKGILSAFGLSAAGDALEKLETQADLLPAKPATPAGTPAAAKSGAPRSPQAPATPPPPAPAPQRRAWVLPVVAGSIGLGTLGLVIALMTRR